MEPPREPGKRMRRRRRADVPGGRSPQGYRVRVSAEEKGLLARLAAEQGVSVQRLLVEAALSERGETPTQRREVLATLFAIRRDLAGLSTNVNQIAKKVNTDGVMPVGSVDALRAIRGTADRVGRVIDELSMS